MSRRLGGALLTVLVLAGVVVLRERTMSRHEPGVPGTTTQIVVGARTRNADAAATTTELATALMETCRLEVGAEPVGPVEQLAPGRYELLLEPALDEFDERQLHGCLEDGRMNHLQLDVRRMRRLPSGEQDLGQDRTTDQIRRGASSTRLTACSHPGGISCPPSSSRVPA